jgi:hypothetical protein
MKCMMRRFSKRVTAFSDTVYAMTPSTIAPLFIVEYHGVCIPYVLCIVEDNNGSRWIAETAHGIVPRRRRWWRR